MMTQLFSVHCDSKQEFEKVIEWGENNGYRCFGDSAEGFDKGEYSIFFYDDGDMASGELEDQNLSFSQFQKEYMKRILTVEEEFILEAYAAACKDWKRKLEDKFPELFVKTNPFIGAKIGDKFMNKETHETYILAQTGPRIFALIGLEHGNRFSDPVNDITLVGDNESCVFTKL